MPHSTSLRYNASCYSIFCALCTTIYWALLYIVASIRVCALYTYICSGDALCHNKMMFTVNKVVLSLASSPPLTPNEPPVMWRLVYHYTSHNLSQTAKKWTGKWMYCVQRKPEKVRRMCLGISRLASNHMLRGFYSCVSSTKSSWCKPCHTSCTGTSLHRG